MTSLLAKHQEIGWHSIAWNAERYASGVYFCVIRNNVMQESIKLMLEK
jgi:hypothetical protein